jgi:hypothetical protein
MIGKFIAWILSLFSKPELAGVRNHEEIAGMARSVI